MVSDGSLEGPSLSYRVVLSTKPGSGAGDGVRTRDMQLGRLPLCQLSYSRPRGLGATRGSVARPGASTLVCPCASSTVRGARVAPAGPGLIGGQFVQGTVRTPIPERTRSQRRCAPSSGGAVRSPACAPGVPCRGQIGPRAGSIPGPVRLIDGPARAPAYGAGVWSLPAHVVGDQRPRRAARAAASAAASRLAEIEGTPL